MTTHDLLRTCRRRRLAPRRRGYALIVSLALLALGMGAAVVMLRSSDLSVRSTVRDDLQRRADVAAQSALDLGIDVLRRRSWPGANWQFSGSWLDEASFVVRYLPGDDSLTPSSPDYVYYPYRITVEAKATVVDPSDATASTTAVATAVLELVPEKLQGAVSGWGERHDYAFYQLDRFNSTGQVKLEPPFQFVGKTRLSDPIKDWCDSYLSSDSRREAYLTGLKRMADAGIEHRPFLGNVEYKTSEQPSSFRTDVVTRLGHTAVDVTPTLEWVVPDSASSYQLYPGGPSYSVPSFNATYGSSPQNLTVAADPKTNPLGLMRLTSNAMLRSDVTVNGMLLASNSSISLQVQGSRCTIQPPKAMLVGERTLGLALQSVCVSEDVEIHASSDDVVFRGAVVCWDKFEIAGGNSWQDVLLEGGVQSHHLEIEGRSNFNSFSGWNLALTLYNATLKIVPFPQWLEATYGLPSAPSIKIKKDVTGATAKHIFDPTRPLYDYPSATDPLAWRMVRLTQPK